MNVHEFESVGNEVIVNMVGQPIFGISFKRKYRSKTLADDSTIKVAQDRVIDPALLFQRLLFISNSGNVSLEDALCYELCPFPATLFEGKEVLRRADKPQLANVVAEFASRESENSILTCAPITEKYVLDGGSLLHRVPWNRGNTYGEIAVSYAEFTVRHYGLATVVFDGYCSGPSIKDATHRRRGYDATPTINFTQDTLFTGRKDEFLARSSNKQRLIDLITTELRKKNCTVINSPGDADVDVARISVEESKCQSTTTVGEDTDVLILLLFYSEGDKELYYRSDKVGHSKIYNITEIKRVLGPDMCSKMLFLHAFTGCDSTSRIHGVGKKNAFYKLAKEPCLQEVASVFLNHGQDVCTIEEAGSKAMALLFGGKCTDSLSSLRFSILNKKVVGGTSFITPERLPPTKSATDYHSRRTYYQVLIWTGQANQMSAADWGWKVENNQCLPVMSDGPAAPDSLLQMVHCNCATTCRIVRCSCRKYGLPCTPACGRCQVDSCENPHNHSRTQDDEEDDSTSFQAW